MSAKYSWIKKPLFLCLLLLLISIGFRFYRLAALSLWSDELFSLATITQVGNGAAWYAFERKSISQLQLGDSFITWKAAEHSPPLFEGLLWLWINVFGTSDFAVRSLSASLGSLAPVIMFFGLRKPLGIFPASMGSLILAVMPSAVLYSQEIRNYSLLIVLSTIATVRIIRHIYEKHVPEYQSKITWWSHYGIDVMIYVLMSYAHYTGFILSFFYIVIRVVSALIGKRKDYYLISYLLVPLLLAPWVYLNWHTMVITNSGSMGWRDYSVQDIWQLMIPAVSTFFIPGKFSLAIISVIFLVTGFLGVRSEHAGLNSTKSWITDIRTLLGLAFLLTFGLQFLHSIYTAFNARVWHWRYFSVSIPMCAAFFALFISQAKSYKILTFVTTLGVALICTQELTNYFKTANKEDYRGATQYIVDKSNSRSLIALTWKPNVPFYLHYLKIMMAKSNKEFDFVGLNSNDDIKYICKLNPSDKSRQVFVLGHYTHKSLGVALKEMCADRFKFRSEQDFYGMFVMEYEISTN